MECFFMKILQVHNFYQFRGGEYEVVENEKAMLEKYGHVVISFYIHNDEIKNYNIFNKLLLLPGAFFS